MASGPWTPPGSRAGRARPFAGAVILPTPGPRPELTPLIATRGAAGQSWPALKAEIRPLFPPGTQNRGSRCGARGSRLLPSGRKRGRGPGAGAVTAPRRRRRACRGRRVRSEILRPAAALSWNLGAMAWPALAGSGRANPALGTQPGAVFFQVRAGPGEPCVFVWWEWITGKLDGRYPANRRALYCLGVNSL